MEAVGRPRAHSAYRRRSEKRSTQGENGRAKGRAIQLMVCIVLLLLAAALRLLFPQTVARLRDGASRLICGSVDYQAAFETVGKGLSGNLRMGEALKEAGVYAFGYSGEGETQVFSGSGRTKTEQTETAASDPPETTAAVSTTADSAAAADTAETVADTAKPDTTVAAAAAGTEKEEAVAEAFRENQADYADLPVPASVTYDYVPVSLDCAPPLAGSVSSGFGYREHPDTKTIKFHYGTDIAADEGAVITAFADVTVTGSGNDPDLGLYLVIRHADGVVTEYGHCSKLTVMEGDQVKKGDPIAAVGSTGNATAPCLHFMVLIDGNYVNPAYYI